MLPGVDFSEMLLLAVLALVLLGPRDLPLMMRKFGRMTGKMRAMAFEFKQGFDVLGRQAELEELRREVESLKKSTGLDELKQDLDKERVALAQDMAKVTAPVTAAVEHPELPTQNPFELAEIETAEPGVAAPETLPEPIPEPEAPANEPPTFADIGAGEENRIGGPAPKPVKQDTPA
jgi:sec-independent protein translocase protein TatB